MGHRLFRNVAMGLLTMLAVSGLYAQQVWATGYGTKTCGEAVSLSETDTDYRVMFTNYLQGYITALNYRGGRSRMVSNSLSSETLAQLWLAKCRLVPNVTKPFFVIADEIYFELEKSKKWERQLPFLFERSGVATFNLADNPELNMMICQEAADLYQADFEKRKKENNWSAATKMRYWYEKGCFKK